MRTIKFRAWQKLGNRMIVIFDSTTQKEWFIPNMKNGVYEYMQSTGLEDCKGNEIYEGDIINYGDYTDGSGPCNYIVAWDADGAAFEIRAIYEKDMAAFLDPSGRVIGNIYENPELLAPERKEGAEALGK